MIINGQILIDMSIDKCQRKPQTSASMITSCRCENYTLRFVKADQKTKFQEKRGICNFNQTKIVLAPHKW